MKALRRVLAALLGLLVGAIVLVFVAVGSYGYVTDRDGPNTETRTIVIPKGYGVGAIADLLVREGFVDNANLFKATAYFEGLQSSLRFGEYEIAENASINEVLDTLAFGRAVELIAVFPEGLSSYEIVERLNSLPDLVGEITDIPPEGFLAPDGYAYSKGDDRQEIIDRMIERQNEILSDAWENRDPDLPLENAQELLVLASIIEKETGNAEERPLVASVFVNRLKKGMKLQTDPTVVYGITEGKGPLGRGLRQSELDRVTAYNTYVIDGLPPTPIANAGEASIRAAANPAQTDFIFFVAKTLKPRDGHVFSITLDEHNRNVAQYRKLEAEAQ